LRVRHGLVRRRGGRLVMCRGAVLDLPVVRLPVLRFFMPWLREPWLFVPWLFVPCWFERGWLLIPRRLVLLVVRTGIDRRLQQGGTGRRGGRIKERRRLLV